jgi:hypothetical protein
MTGWLVLIERTSPDDFATMSPQVVGSEVGGIVHALARYAAVGRGDDRKWWVLLTVDEASPQEALTLAQDAVIVAAGPSKLARWPESRSDVWPAAVLVRFATGAWAQPVVPDGSSRWAADDSVAETTSVAGEHRSSREPKVVVGGPGDRRVWATTRRVRAGLSADRSRREKRATGFRTWY